MKKFVEIIKMDYKIILSVEAENDTNTAYCYYENQQSGLGECFPEELSCFYNKLEHPPENYSFTSGNKKTRSVALKTFPYKIINEIEGKELYVYAVYHFHQNPEDLSKRF